MPFSNPTRLHEEFSTALRAGDIDALVAMYEEHAVQLQPDGSVSDDRGELRTMFEGLVRQGPMPDVPQRLVVVSEDLALTSTSYVFPAPEGLTTTMTTAEVSRRQSDGSWQVAIDAPTFLTSHS